MRDETYVTLDDGCVQVCLSQGQWQVCCFVSSHTSSLMAQLQGPDRLPSYQT